MSGCCAWIYVVLILNGVQTAAANGADAVAEGRSLYGQFCQRCHGRELVSSGASTYDLRNFPHGARDRFVLSVSEGLNSMPPHGDILSPQEIDALYEYVTAQQAQSE